MDDVRRRFPRVGAPKLMYVGFDCDNGGILLNAAEGGIAVRIVNGLPLRSRVQLELRVPGKPPINAEGDVVWADGSGRVGIRFLQISHDSRQQLRDWVLREGTDALGAKMPLPETGEFLPTDDQRFASPATGSLGSGASMPPTGPDTANTSRPLPDVQKYRENVSELSRDVMTKSESLPVKKLLPSRRFAAALASVAIILLCGTAWLYVRTNDAHLTPSTVPLQAPERETSGIPLTIRQQQPQLQARPDVPHPNQLPIITNISATPLDGNATIVIDIGSRVKYASYRLSTPDRIYFDIEASLAPQLWGKVSTLRAGPVVKFRSAQRDPGIARVTLQTREVCEYYATIKPDPFRLVVQVRESH